jgi:drug/metabolite transporter (DMT)-like permease
VPVYLFSGSLNIPAAEGGALTGNDVYLATANGVSRYWWPVLGLTMVTFLSRLTLFFGVKHLGGMQAALLGLGELLVTLVFAHWLLGETLTTQQWIGASLLVLSLALVGLEKPPGRRQGTGGFLSWMGSSRLTSEGWQTHD